jgi:N-sulfoglucosamine sulfohydrolase
MSLMTFLDFRAVAAMLMGRRRGVPAIPALVVAASVAVSVGHAAAERPPNILWIVSEDNGPELGSYGDRYARTPNLDRLAAEGVRFANAFVPYALCSPSRAAFLTGLHPQQNGQLGLATHRFEMYRGNTPNIVTRLRPAGYHTGLIGKLHINPEEAFPFDFSAVSIANFQRKEPGEAYVREAVRFWDEAGDRPWFLSVNFPDAHLPFIRQAHGSPAKPLTGRDVKPLPWVGADSERLRELTADYYNCMARLDDDVGLLLEALKRRGAAGNTMVVYFGDHGAQFPRAKHTVYDAGLRIPLLIRWPGKTVPGTVRSELVSTLDLLPTVLKAVSLPLHELPGRALQPILGGDKPAGWREYIHAVTTGGNARTGFVQESVQDSRWKLISTPPQSVKNGAALSALGTEDSPPYIETGLLAAEYAALTPVVRSAYERWVSPPRYELYDLQNDRHEWHNRSEDPAVAPIKARLIAALEAHQKEIGDPFMDQRNVEAYVREQVANRASDYRNDQSFHWRHVDEFRKWRERHAR